MRPTTVKPFECITTKEEYQPSISLLHSILDSTADGILAVDLEGNIERYNAPFAEMWQIPDALLSSGDGRRTLQFVRDQLRHPEAFLADTEESYGHPGKERCDTLECKDGRVFECYSKPRRLGPAIVGRVWSLRHVTPASRPRWP